MEKPHRAGINGGSGFVFDIPCTLYRVFCRRLRSFSRRYQWNEENVFFYTLITLPLFFLICPWPRIYSWRTPNVICYTYWFYVSELHWVFFFLQTFHLLICETQWKCSQFFESAFCGQKFALKQSKHEFLTITNHRIWVWANYEQLCKILFKS